MLAAATTNTVAGLENANAAENRPRRGLESEAPSALPRLVGGSRIHQCREGKCGARCAMAHSVGRSDGSTENFQIQMRWRSPRPVMGMGSGSRAWLAAADAGNTRNRTDFSQADIGGAHGWPASSRFALTDGVHAGSLGLTYRSGQRTSTSQAASSSRRKRSLPSQRPLVAEERFASGTLWRSRIRASPPPQ
jgi:hypothetical protein